MKRENTLTVDSFNKFALKRFKFFFKNYFKNVVNNKSNFFFKTITLPTKKKKHSLLRSPHVNKKAWEQFEIRWFKIIFFFNFIFYNRIYFFEKIPLNISYILKNLIQGRRDPIN